MRRLVHNVAVLVGLVALIYVLVALASITIHILGYYR